MRQNIKEKMNRKMMKSKRKMGGGHFNSLMAINPVPQPRKDSILMIRPTVID